MGWLSLVCSQDGLVKPGLSVVRMDWLSLVCSQDGLVKPGL